MANSIIGESFSAYVQEQIEQRQTKLNLNYPRDDRWLMWRNANTAFVRLSSGIDINSDQGASAQKYQLFNTQFDGNKLASGVGLGGNTLYGWESDPGEGYGYTIPPGIISADIKAQNRGSLREANIQIKCHNKKQFNIISKLYLRLGYSMLLEWGWSYYYDNDDVFHENYHILANQTNNTFLFNPDQTPQGILNAINKDRELSCGNYDAIIGVVSNYSWNLERDGSYSITLTLKTWGDITESLKANKSTDPDPTKEVDPNVPNLTALDKNANKSDLNKILYNLANYLFINQLNRYDSLDNAFITSLTNLTPTQDNAPYGSAIGEIISLSLSGLDPTTNSGQPQGQSNNVNQQQYIKLGALLRIIQNYALMYNTLAPEKDSLVNVYPSGPNKNVDLSIPCFKLESSISLDPRVCVIPFKEIGSGGLNLPGVKIPTSPATPINRSFIESLSYFLDSGFPYIGLAEEIHININHIAKVLDSYIIRETGAVSVYDFLQNLMKDVQSALGNINNFEVIYDEDDNTIKIIDSTFIPGIENYLPSVDFNTSIPFIINTLDSSYGSFLRDTKIQSKLSNAFASQTTIGAQANGNVVGEDATMLSKFNDGLVDRLCKEKNTESTNPNPLDQLQKYLHILVNYKLETDYGTITPEFIDGFKSDMIDLYRYAINTLVSSDVINPPGFLPIDLEITMDGLSGIKIYENYTIDPTMLPEDYVNNIKFITTGVSHKIQGNDWTTTLNSVMSPIGGTVVNSTSAGVGTSAAAASGQTVTVPTPPPVKHPSVLAPQSTVTKAVTYAEKFISDLGLTNFQSAALLGNFMAEGFPNPDRIQGPGVITGKLKIDGTTGYGWAQWTFQARQQDLANFATSKGVNYQTTNLTDDINYGFVIKELTGNLSYVLPKIKATTTLEEAVNVVMTEYELPKDQSTLSLNKRKNFAQQVLDKL